ncbi:MAG: hypothetical protein ACRD3C_06535 [Vicinamibacterales bacterium]
MPRLWCEILGKIESPERRVLRRLELRDQLSRGRREGPAARLGHFAGSYFYELESSGKRFSAEDGADERDRVT